MHTSFVFNACRSAATAVSSSPSASVFARENMALHKGIDQLLAGCGGSSGMLRSWSTYEQLHSLLQEWAK